MAARALSMMRAGAHLPPSRQAIEDEIERLIGLLDMMDGDPEVEPSLGWVTSPLSGACELADSSDLEGDFADWEIDQDDEEDHRHFPVELNPDCPPVSCLHFRGLGHE